MKDTETNVLEAPETKRGRPKKQETFLYFDIPEKVTIGGIRYGPGKRIKVKQEHVPQLRHTLYLLGEAENRLKTNNGNMISIGTIGPDGVLRS